MGSKIRWILVGSLGGLLLLITAAGAASLAMFERLQRDEAAQRAHLEQHRTWLLRVERGVYLSGTLARDYLADPDGPNAPALLASLRQVQDDTRRAAGQIADGARPLRAEVSAYGAMLALMLDMARKHSDPGVAAYFRRQLAGRRENMLHLAEEIAAALDAEWRQGEGELAARYARMRWMLAAETALVAGFGLLLSAGAARRLLRLEGETRKLAAQLERAQEEERRSLARELHDEIGQAVSGMVLDVGRAASLAESAPLRAQLEAVSAAGERTVESVRRMALSLRPSMLDDLGLVAALEWQAREVGNRTGLDVAVSADDSAGELPDEQRTCIYRVTQEALRNCARHAGASTVRVGLKRGAHAIALEVADNGKGFQPARTKGLGLLGIEERVARLGGRLRVRSEAGRGTVLSVELPL